MLLASDSAFDSWTCVPRFEHGGFEVDDRLQLRLEAFAHRRFDRAADEEADEREQHDGEDRPDPDLAFEEEAGARDRAADAGVGPGHVGRGAAVAVVRMFGTT